MKNSYQTETENKQRSTKTGVAFLACFISVFLAVIFRIAIRSELDGALFTSGPSDKDAYEIAKDFIKTTTVADVQFTDDDFQCIQKSDATYEVRSSFENKADHLKTDFVIILKYNGGNNLSDKSWSVIKQEEHQ